MLSLRLQQHGSAFDILENWSLQSVLYVCVWWHLCENLQNQFLLLTVIQVSSFGVVTSSYLDSTTWPSRRCSRSLCTSELNSTAATVYANLNTQERKESRKDRNTLEFQQTFPHLPQFRASLISQKTQQWEALHHRFICKSIRIKPAQLHTQGQENIKKIINMAL